MLAVRDVIIVTDGDKFPMVEGPVRSKSSAKTFLPMVVYFHKLSEGGEPVRPLSRASHVVRGGPLIRPGRVGLVLLQWDDVKWVPL